MFLVVGVWLIDFGVVFWLCNFGAGFWLGSWLIEFGVGFLVVWGFLIVRLFGCVSLIARF